MSEKNLDFLKFCPVLRNKNHKFIKVNAPLLNHQLAGLVDINQGQKINYSI